MATLGYGTVYLAGKPVVAMVSAVSSMVISKSTPTFNEELDSIFDENAVKATGHVDQSEVAVPLYETYYAKISCERVNLIAPIYWGDSDKALKQGVGQYIGSFMPGYGKPLLMSSHDSTYFAPLEDIEIGDVIQITTNYGDYEYKVTDLKVTNASDRSAFDLTQDKEELILYTCYPFGAMIGVKNERYFVYADKISGPEIVQGGTDDGTE
ncbi:MAG: hypothetical protein K0S47_3863 [Herbinix sp.]|jgi:sortase A|nr:hypothetical protein [Herbinix sp.]